MEDVREQAEQESQLLGQDGENETVTEDATFIRGEPSQDANGPPTVDSKAEILHEKVTKQIIKEGHGQIPSKYSTCFCQDGENETVTEDGTFVRGEPSQDANGPPKVDLRWKSFTRKSQSKSLRKVMVKYHPSVQHASYTTGHGLKARDTSLKTHGMNNDHLK